MFADPPFLLLGQKALKAQVTQGLRIELLFKGPVFRGSGIHIQQSGFFIGSAWHDLPLDGVETQGSQVLQQLMPVRLIKGTAVVLIGELAGEIGMAENGQSSVIEAETASSKSGAMQS